MTKCSFLGRKSNISQETLSKSHLVAHSVDNELRPILKVRRELQKIQYSKRTLWSPERKRMRRKQTGLSEKREGHIETLLVCVCAFADSFWGWYCPSNWHDANTAARCIKSTAYVHLSDAQCVGLWNNNITLWAKQPNTKEKDINYYNVQKPTKSSKKVAV